jgi:hypothetical protein
LRLKTRPEASGNPCDAPRMIVPMHKPGSFITATLLTLVTAASAFADAPRKPFVGICEGVVQLGFFIDGSVFVPAGKTHRVRSIGQYKCMFTDPEISAACPNGTICRVIALMRGGNQFQILNVFGVASLPEAPISHTSPAR